ncbi:MAG TPA: cyclic nucleotide-binding domain-containing protein [Kofleriaceae bacterium]|nr:cyclic nucleotide-binding domain-containing protein [Kofleriaceae bacterium]
MAAATSTQPAVRPAGAVLRNEGERALVTAAGAVFALGSGGAAMSAAAADAMFLSELGPAHLGEAVAVSSALLAVVLAVVGGLADRLERRRVLAALALGSAAVIAALAALSLVAPVAAAVATLIGGKQLAAATDLAFWVVIAERLDARRSRRMLPLLAATGGAGAAAGAVLVVPVAAAAGARGVLLCGAALLVLAAAGAARLPATRRVGAPPARVGALIARSWRDGARAVRRHALARQLAILVGAAGVFASLVYFALGVAVVTEGGSTADLAALLGGVRGAGQVLTLLVQLALAPRLLAWLGTGRALLLAPLVALASGLGLVVAPVLAVAIATQISARVLDAGVETPAEKLAQTLLPSAVRGRVGGFLDGTAKRAGAAAGGLIAAALAGSPASFYAVMATAAALWLVAAARLARELPALAIEHVVRVADEGDDDIDVDARAMGSAVEVLHRELGGPKPERAAEVLARLHERGRVDAVEPLVRAATERGGEALWRTLIGVLGARAEVHGPALSTAAQRARGAELELCVRAIGLCGGVSSDEVRALAPPGGDAALVLTAEIAELRLLGDEGGVLARLAEAIRDSGPMGRAATDELCVELGVALAGAPAPGAKEPGADDARTLEAARHLARALRRGRGNAAGRNAAFAQLQRAVARLRDRRSAELSLLRTDLLELVRERVEAGTSRPAPDHMLVSLVLLPVGIADETPAALRLFGALLDGADAIEPDDLRRIARALGEPDDDVRAAAEEALTALGPAAAGELVATVAWGRRRARDRAAALLAELPVTPATLDRLIDAELDALDQTHTAIAVLVEPGDELLARRLDERLREIARTVLLLVAARRRSPAISEAAAAWGRAHNAQERARTLAVIETALPRALVTRLVDAVDELAPAERAAALARGGVAPPARDAVIRAELAGRDRLARALALHVLGAAGRSAHRQTIAEAARAEARQASPADLLRRVSESLTEQAALEEGATDMPSRVETLIALGRVPLLAALTTRQLADVAERARWSHAREGAVVVTAGDLVDALIIVDDGELALGERRIVKGEVVDELACVAPQLFEHDLRAVRAVRLIRLERPDFEELVDDVPGLASAICRALGERARRAEDRGYRSPLTSRV